MAAPERRLTEGQRAYEAKRAAKAGMSLEKWLASREREREAAKPAPVAPKPQGKARAFFSKLMEKANKPIG
ncbi:hypothetical protein [Roseomonas gilardii]|uniref:hypothetical protein n=1 Tax=Roseomonas gilardii TaxID=257708 RepID=UPI001643F0B2|nr:hypothetical protein [Roseomonas gilardii]